MISSENALKLVLDHSLTLKTELIPLKFATGRVLAQTVKSDRDFPPFHRVSMDGIAINYNAYKKGDRKFKIESTQFAGDRMQTLKSKGNCIEIMTGATLPKNCDTAIQYEHLEISNSSAEVKVPVKKGQNVHRKGLDRKKGEVLSNGGTFITGAEVAALATVGISKVRVFKNPKCVVICTGNELVDVNVKPKDYQIRMSNAYSLQSLLNEFGIDSEILHIRDTKKDLRNSISSVLKKYDLILFSGGVSKGKADFVPEILEDLGVEKLFHKVRQRPGKPFWFGKKNKKVIFAFPGNPVSCFCGFIKYCKPFLLKSYSVDNQLYYFAELTKNFNFKPSLTYFLQVKQMLSKDGKLKVEPAAGHGSGDLANLLKADGFLELPANKTIFKKGEVYPFHPYR